jgi:hypothetical protein
MSVNAHKYVWTITTKLITCHQVFSSMHHVMSVMLLPLLAVLIKKRVNGPIAEKKSANQMHSCSSFLRIHLGPLAAARTCVLLPAHQSSAHVCACWVASIPLAGLLDYMVDFGKKEVTVRGKVEHTKKKKKHRKTLLGAAGWDDDARSAAASSPGGGQARTLSWFLGCYGS